jgi:hypothetical protein
MADIRRPTFKPADQTVPGISSTGVATPPSASDTLSSYVQDTFVDKLTVGHTKTKDGKIKTLEIPLFDFEKMIQATGLARTHIVNALGAALGKCNNEKIFRYV